jgi:MFS family permease
MFTLPIVSAVMLFTGISMASTLTPFFFQGAMGYTASQVGLISMVVPLFMMFAAPMGGAWYDKRHNRFQAAAGLAAYAVGMLVVGYGVLDMNLWVIVLGFAIRGIGSGLFSSPNSIETLGTVPVDKVAMASSVQSTINFMASMIGVALSTIVVTVALNQNGYYGPVLLSGPSLLSNSIGVAMLLSAALCVLGMIVAILRNIGQADRQPKAGSGKEAAG